jgi:CubicO group peptidase (beta-lactamase class C family)
MHRLTHSQRGKNNGKKRFVHFHVPIVEKDDKPAISIRDRSTDEKSTFTTAEVTDMKISQTKDMHGLLMSITTFFMILALSMGCRNENSNRMEDRIDAVLSLYDHADGPGAAVLVMKDDSVVFKKGYGLADIETRTPVATTTNFRLASVTKQFTAMCILMLAEKGRLSLEDPVVKFFPDFPSYGKDIRIRHLLTHTSGLRDYEDLIPKTLQRQVYDIDCLELMKTTDSLYFPTGSAYRYSNTGYAILALVTEKVTGRRFADFLKDSVFAPVGMPTTVAFEDGRSKVANRAFGHSRNGNGWWQTDQSQTSAVLGDGGIYSNVEELAKWTSSLWHHRLISDSMQNRAWTRATLNDGSGIDYGYGWHIEGDDGHPHHDGSTMGFRNHILVYPKERMMVAVMTNRNEGDPKGEALKIAALYRD